MIIFQVPVTIKIVTALISILVINKFFKNLLASVSAGILILLVWNRFSVQQIFDIFYGRLTSPKTLLLLLVIFQITVLSNLMSATGMMKRLVGAVNSFVSPVWGIAVLPAIIGFLPIPGGAIFSAPLVDDCDEKKEVDAILKTKINYWFRHIWEFWWPLYPGVLLAISLTGLKTVQYVMLMSPLTLFTVAGGYVFLLRKVRLSHGRKSSSRNVLTLLNNIFKQMYPVVIVVGLFGLINIAAPQLSAVSNYLPMIIAVFIALGTLYFFEKPSAELLKKNIFNKKNIDLIVLVAVILLYGAAIEAKLPSGDFMMNVVRDEISNAGIPVLLVISLLPFISGLSTGISVALVGASFPIVMGLIPHGISDFQFHAYVLLAAGSGFIGMILSPVHICLIVTNNYFKSSLTASLSRLIKPVMFIVGGIVLLFSFNYFILG